MTAPVASGWSISPGGAFTHWKSAAFARRTPYADDRELIMDIMRYGAECEVISPPELAKRIEMEAESLLALYRKRTN